MSEIYIIRHGQASFGQDNYDRLSALGIQQARILGDHFNDTGLRIDAAYCGTLQRQRSTADEVLRLCQKNSQPLIILDKLNEYDSAAIVSSQVPDMIENDPGLHVDLEKMYTSSESFKKIFEQAMFRWVSGRHDKPGVETWEGFVSRVSGAIKQIMKDHDRGSKILVFTSGGPVCATLKWVLGLSDESAIQLNWQIVNTSYSRFMYNEQRITLAGFNSIAHLERHSQQMITYK
ncbi:MAG: histidine phosphatase family protein [Thermodesulfobacteriota bacterium]|nr:histidine phosphatase family protein [Thermodesulfobacteriota bacterium]